MVYAPDLGSGIVYDVWVRVPLRAINFNNNKKVKYMLKGILAIVSLTLLAMSLALLDRGIFLDLSETRALTFYIRSFPEKDIINIKQGCYVYKVEYIDRNTRELKTDYLKYHCGKLIPVRKGELSL